MLDYSVRERIHNLQSFFQLVNKTRCEPRNECLEARTCSQKFVFYSPNSFRLNLSIIKSTVMVAIENSIYWLKLYPSISSSCWSLVIGTYQLCVPYPILFLQMRRRKTRLYVQLRRRLHSRRWQKNMQGLFETSLQHSKRLTREL